jgi:hypothetical protein
VKFFNSRNYVRYLNFDEKIVSRNTYGVVNRIMMTMLLPIDRSLSEVIPPPNAADSW